MELARNLKSDNVARLQPAPPVVVATDCTIGDAVKLMRQKQVSWLLVCAGKKLAGIFTQRDLLMRVIATNRPLKGPIREVMTPDPVTVTPKDSVRRAILRMEKGKHGRLPVVDETGRPVGMLTDKRLVHYLAEHFASTVYNQPPDVPNYPQHRGGA
jgi:CBS domain-containing protein